MGAGEREDKSRGVARKPIGEGGWEPRSGKVADRLIVPSVALKTEVPECPWPIMASSVRSMVISLIGYFHVSVIFRLSASTATARACSSEPNHAAEYCAVTALAASARSERLTRLTFSPLAASTLRSSLGKLRRLSGRDFDATVDSEPPRGERSPLSSSLLAVLCDVSFSPPSVLLL